MLDSCKMLQGSMKHSIRFCGIFPSLKHNFIVYRSSKVSSRPDCIFEIHQLWLSGFSMVYSNCCCSCSLESEIIKIGQSSPKMHSNNILNSQDSTILNACTKKSVNLLNTPRIIQFGWALNYSGQEFRCVVNWCSLRSCAKNMTITIGIINPRQEMGLECGWRHVQKRWAENLEDFEKDSVEFRPWCWEVGVRPWCWEVGVRSWCWEVGVRPWCWEVGVRPCSWGFEIGPCRQTIERLRMEFSAIELSSLPSRHVVGVLKISTDRDLKHYKMHWAFVGSDSMVSIKKLSLSSCRRTEARS